MGLKIWSKNAGNMKKYEKFLLLPFQITLILMALFLGLIFLLLFLIIMIPWILSVPFSHAYEHLKLRSKHRLVSSRKLISRLEQSNPGTLIVEVGPSQKTYWWTSEKVREKSPVPYPKKSERKLARRQTCSLPWDQWVWETYLKPKCGTATLIHDANRQAIEKKLLRLFPDIEIAHIWTTFLNSPQIAVSSENTTYEKE